MINFFKYISPRGAFYTTKIKNNQIIKTRRSNFGLLACSFLIVNPSIKQLSNILFHHKKILSEINDIFLQEKIIASNVPHSLIGNPVFNELGYTQDKVIAFYDSYTTPDQCFELFKKWVSKIHELWTYGYHEQSLNFEINSGFDKNGNCILFDFNEITDSYNQALVDIKSKKWYRQASFHKIRFIGHQGLRTRILDYIDQEFTEEKLNLFWNKRHR